MFLIGRSRCVVGKCLPPCGFFFIGGFGNGDALENVREAD
jgi:hypothetical protein